jgi:hypothetical protein
LDYLKSSTLEKNEQDEKSEKNPQHHFNALLQNAVFNTLTKINLFNILSAYSPILVGTIPIGINIENSDLDIILNCRETDQENLIELIETHFGHHFGFTIGIQSFHDANIIMAHFSIPITVGESGVYAVAMERQSGEKMGNLDQTISWPNSIEVEIFAQNRATDQQNGYLHMIKEAQVLDYFEKREKMEEKEGSFFVWENGKEISENLSTKKSFREGIIELKRSGVKTEPAFVQLLGIGGDDINPYEALLEYSVPNM